MNQEQAATLQPGDVVELYPEPTHEGPHPDDQYDVAPLVEVIDVTRHPNNARWIQSVIIDDFQVKREVTVGSIARKTDRVAGDVRREMDEDEAASHAEER